MIDAVVVGAGQSGLAAAHALRQAGRSPVVLEAGQEPVGSWLEWQRSFASATLRGVGRDARYVVRALSRRRGVRS